MHVVVFDIALCRPKQQSQGLHNVCSVDTVVYCVFIYISIP